MVAPVGPGGRANGSAGGYRRVEPVSGAARRQDRASDEASRESRALVPTEAPRSEPRHHYFGTDAAFLAHLIATDQDHPQTRERRRAEPVTSTQAYASAARSTFSLPAGAILNRSA